MMNTLGLKRKLENESHIWFRGVLSNSDLDKFDYACNLGAKAGARFSIPRDLESVFHKNGSIFSCLNQLIPNVRPVRCVYFNKTNDANWAVPWHQDRVIAVKEKHEIDGYKNWSNKHGLWHCEPPLNILKQMLFVRIHLDDNSEENGAMEIAKGSHLEGFVASEEAQRIAEKYQTHLCEAKRGDVLVLNMMMLHRSLASRSLLSRRTLRVDFAGDILPKPLDFS